MTRGYRYESGHSPGGVDVTEAVNLAFKGILLSPIFILCIFITIAMLKHMIFGGIPTMNQPTEQQREELRQRDAEIQPRAVWGGSQQTTEIIEEIPSYTDHKSALERVMEEPEVIPYTIYERKPPQPEEPATWETEILEDPFQ